MNKEINTLSTREAFRLFIMERRLNGIADGTIKNYRDALDPIIDRHGDGLVENIAPHIHERLMEFAEADIARSTMSMRYRTVKAFCSFLANEGFVSEPIRVPTIKEPAPSISPLTIDDMRLILKTFDRNEFLGFRDWVMVSFMFDTGVRRGEVVRLTIPDINLDDGFAFIRGKGNKERHVPISKSVRGHLWDLQKRSATRRKRGVTSAFVSRSGDPLHDRGISSVFRRINRAGVVPTKAHPHLIRHSFAVAFIEAGGDQFALQRILGHATLEMSNRYVTLARGSVQAIHARFSPINMI